MAALTADGPAVRFHRPVIQTAPGEDPGIGIVLILVGFIQAGCVLVKRISVLHDEFPAAHEPEPGPFFIPELALDLV